MTLGSQTADGSACARGGLPRVNRSEWQNRFAIAARTAFINAERLGASKSQCHPDMARRKSQPQVKPLGIDAAVMR